MMTAPGKVFHRLLVSLAALGIVAAISSSAQAGSFLEKAKPELQAFGALAGYIVATIGPCGGDDAEIEFFTGQVKKMLDAIGGDEADLAIVTGALAKGRASAKPQGRDCTDEGGVELATKFSQLRDAIRDVGK
jgi:hypothetical protein